MGPHARVDPTAAKLFDHHPRALSYPQLHGSARVLASALKARLADTRGPKRVAFLLTPDTTWLTALFGTWLAGAAAVPLCVKHSPAELAYVLKDSRSSVLLTEPAFEKAAIAACEAAMEPLLLHQAMCGGDGLAQQLLDSVSSEDDALVIYTSGTTSQPKGTVCSLLVP
jgi:acyl-CoA synthetase (AMP-forming)/AMP-acid ligase II